MSIKSKVIVLIHRLLFFGSKKYSPAVPIFFFFLRFIFKQVKLTLGYFIYSIIGSRFTIIKLLKVMFNLHIHITDLKFLVSMLQETFGK